MRLLRLAPALAHGPLAGAQNATPGAGASNPIVGAWIVNDPNGTPAIAAFTADGVMVDTETSGGAGIGAWMGQRGGECRTNVPYSDTSINGLGSLVKSALRPPRFAKDLGRRERI
jgi:hypothetical protein